MNEPETYAFIPARRGSKRVQRKNFALINGRPLLAFTVETALQSGVFTKVFVNSEDDELLEIARRYGADTYKRPAEYASDTTYIIEIIQEMIHSCGLDDRTVMGVLFPTVPLRSADDIRTAYAVFREGGGRTPVVSVTSYEYPVQLALDINIDNRLEPLFPHDYYRSTRHNDHKRMYRANFAIVFNIVEILKSQKNLIGQRPIPYIMPPERSVDIDDPFQMEVAKILLGRLATQNVEKMTEPDRSF